MATETVVLKVAMTCESCVGAVKRAIAKLNGVDSYNIDLKEQKVSVTGNVKPDEVLDRISRTGKTTAFWPKDDKGEAVAA
jgi:copper chaperone